MAKEREGRKKEKQEKKEKKEKKERKERKRREAEELEVREKKISKKHKSESKKSKKKSKKSDSDVEEKPHKKSKESKKKHKRSEESQESEIVRPDDSLPVTVPIATTTTTTTVTNESDSDFEYDKEDIRHLLESYSKEELVNLIYKTAEKGSRLISAVLESADRDSARRNLFVRGLGWDTTHENLKAAFEVYGEIEECSVVMDKDTGRAKGYGFVLFKTRKGAREALRNPEKRMYNRTVSCNIAVAKPAGAGKPREPVESVKIDLTHTGNQSELALPGMDLGHGHGLDKGHQQQQQQHQNMPMYAGQNMPFYGHGQPPPGFNPMYGPLMGNQGALMGGGLPNYRMFGSGMMNQGPPPNHMGMAGQYVGDGNGVGPGFDGERAWYLR